MDGTLVTSDTRAVLRFERRLAHPPDRVWRAITDPAELASWFPAAVEVDLTPGGAMRFDLGGGRPIDDGEITELDPPRVIEYTWGDETLRFELRPEDDGCELVFTHTFDARDRAADFAAGWHACLDSLEAALAGEPSEPSMERWDEVYDGYAESFGVREPAKQTQEAPDGTAEKAADGRYVLRFERRLDRPVERVWAALTRPDELVKWLAEAEIELAVGGRVELRWLNVDEEGNQAVARGTITRLDPPHLLEIETDRHGLLHWELRGEEGGRCALTFTSTVDLSGEGPAENLGGWHIHLDHLADALAGRPVDWPNWWRDYGDRFAELRDRYAAKG